MPAVDTFAEIHVEIPLLQDPLHTHELQET